MQAPNVQVPCLSGLWALQICVQQQSGHFIESGRQEETVRLKKLKNITLTIQIRSSAERLVLIFQPCGLLSSLPRRGLHTHQGFRGCWAVWGGLHVLFAQGTLDHYQALRAFDKWDSCRSGNFPVNG